LKTIGLFSSSHMNILKEYVKVQSVLERSCFEKFDREETGEGTLNPLH